MPMVGHTSYDSNYILIRIYSWDGHYYCPHKKKYILKEKKVGSKLALWGN